MSVAAVLTAAGSGSRLGHALPKALVPLAGEPLVRHAARRLLAARAGDGERIETLVVTAPADHVAHVERSLTGLAGDVRVVVVAGGVTRQASVAAALAVLGAPASSDGGTAGAVPSVVLVHDAARPLVPEELVGRVIDAVRAGRTAVIPGLPVTDTIKQVDAPEDGGVPARRVVATVDRDRLRAVQTPQGFAFDLLRAAHDEAAAHAYDEALAASDDAGLVERLGGAVWVVDGDERAAKITTPRDLAIAELLLRDDPGTGPAAHRVPETAPEAR